MAENETGRASPDDRVDVVLQVGEPGALEPEELASLTALLREELLELDVDDVRSVVEGEAPPGSKAVELAALGALVVRLAKSPKVLLEVVRAIAGWVERGDARRVHMQIGGDTLEVTGISTADQRALINAWIERQSAPPT